MTITTPDGHTRVFIQPKVNSIQSHVIVESTVFSLSQSYTRSTIDNKTAIETRQFHMATTRS